MLLASAALLLSALAGQAPTGAWREAPEFLTLFAPAGAASRAYRMYVSTLNLDAVLRVLDVDPSLAHPPGAWQPQPLPPSDAFGQAGRYDRSKLRRLYGAQRPRVARGARLVRGRAVEFWTLISPHPDAALQHLAHGTLLIVLRVP